MEMQFRLKEETWGMIQHVQQEAAGVFHLATMRPPHGSSELYVVTPEAVPKIISEETLSYGTAIEGGYAFEIYVEKNGFDLVQYELKRHELRCDPSDENRGELYAEAIYTADKYPVYFGGITPPRDTPWGLVLRVKKVAEGVYFLETDRLEWVMAVASPIWQVDLSEHVRMLGCFFEQEQAMEWPEARYLYFKKDQCGPVVYELLDYADFRGLLNFIPSKEALETQIYIRNPEYAMLHNQIQLGGGGKSDLLNNLARNLGLEELVEKSSPELEERRRKRCIYFRPELAHEKLLLLPEYE